jgi:hypothetical protein
VLCGSPAEFCYTPPVMNSPYSVEYVGVPLEPPPLQGYPGGPIYQHEYYEIEGGETTADAIASQSQDYVDEKLAEYQATIHQLQSEYIPFFYILMCSCVATVSRARDARAFTCATDSFWLHTPRKGFGYASEWPGQETFRGRNHVQNVQKVCSHLNVNCHSPAT